MTTIGPATSPSVIEISTGSSALVELDGATSVIVETTAATGALEVSPATAPSVIEVAVPGIRGPAGADGASGGGSGPDSDEPYVFVQSSPALPWHIVHGRGTRPSVVIVRDDGTVIEGFGIAYPDANTVDVFAGLIKGTATLNF